MARRFISILLVFFILSPALSAIAAHCMKGTDCPMCTGGKTCALMKKQQMKTGRGGADKTCPATIRCCNMKAEAAFSFIIKELPSPEAAVPEPVQGLVLAVFTPAVLYSNTCPPSIERPPSLV